MPDLARLTNTLKLWLDSDARQYGGNADRTFNAVRVIPFIILHVSCLLVLITGASTIAVAVCVLAFFIRMFAITGFYHRYFSHRAFKTSRAMQFLFAVLGASAAQRGALWWAAHHRHHHQHSDAPEDLHSPHVDGFWWAHAGWFTCDAAFDTRYERIRDFASFPELRFLNRFDALVPLVMLLSMALLGALLDVVAPSLGTSALQMAVWGFAVSTVLLFHATVSINSLAHVWGQRRYNTRDSSRNNAWLALLTLGEGWHNNHHRYPRSARQGFFWWEVDITFYLLCALERLGLIWDLTPVPAHILAEGRSTHMSHPRDTRS